MNHVFQTNVTLLLREIIRSLASEEIEESEDTEETEDEDKKKLKTPKLDFKIWKLPTHIGGYLTLISAKHFGPLNRKGGIL